jgi:hypothetical protein
MHDEAPIPSHSHDDVLHDALLPLDAYPARPPSAQFEQHGERSAIRPISTTGSPPPAEVSDFEPQPQAQPA